MNGKQHYEEAEWLLTQAAKEPPTMQQVLAALAQVHATLALVQAQLVIAATSVSSPAAVSIWTRWGEDL